MALIFLISSFLGILPIVLWLLFFLWQDILKPEPIKYLLIIFGMGILITPLVWYGEGLYLKLFEPQRGAAISFWQMIFIYGGIALIEEIAKFLSACFILKRNKHFDEAVDAMIYLIVLALGFGLVENILAASQEIAQGGFILTALQTVSLRFVGANLLHALCSGIIGFFWALSYLKKKIFLYWGLFLGITLHFFFNVAIIKLGEASIFFISFGLFVVSAALLWAFDLLKQIKKPIKYPEH